jgi:pimeloyl-ACP methyl ester carboxylesterase
MHHALLPLVLSLLPVECVVAPPRAQDPPAPAPTPAAPQAERAAQPFETIRRTLPDGIVMTADLYRAPLAPDEAAKPVLVCMHMTGSSRGEYRTIAPKLVEMGLNVLAVDLRCGGAGEIADRRTKERSGTMNETWKMAMEKLGHPPSYVDAYPDVGEAVAWAHELFPDSRVGLLGSSFSASLALVYAAEHESELDVVIALSPGEYMPPWSIAQKVRKLEVPAYITCGNTAVEMDHAKPIAAAVKKRAQVQKFWPEDEKLIGDHGSRTLTLKSQPESLARQWKELAAAIAPLKEPLDAAEIEKRKKARAKPPAKKD